MITRHDCGSKAITHICMPAVAAMTKVLCISVPKRTTAQAACAAYKPSCLSWLPCHLYREPYVGRLLQVVLRVAPPELLAQLYDSGLQGHLLQLAQHPIANFVVQAWLAAVTTTPQVCSCVRTG